MASRHARLKELNSPRDTRVPNFATSNLLATAIFIDADRALRPSASYVFVIGSTISVGLPHA